VQECVHCGGQVERSFRYCPWCAAPLRRKLVEFFTAHPRIDHDHGKALRVSRYFGATPDERHVRFSVWNETGVAQAALSLDEDEAERLRCFLAGEPLPPRMRHGVRAAVGRALGI
jgi:hypothetical protein